MPNCRVTDTTLQKEGDVERERGGIKGAGGERGIEREG